MSALDLFVPKPLPEQYKWVEEYAAKKGPNLVREALKCHGIKEIRGTENSPEIMAMAAALGGVIDDFYTKDEIPWCGLAVAYWIKQAGFEPPKNYSQVRARDYASWGIPSDKPSFGDVMSFWRGTKAGRDGHVGIYIQEDPHYYHIYGGNQSDQVGFTRISKERLLAARRCPWKIKQPFGVRPIIVAAGTGAISKNEA